MAIPKSIITFVNPAFSIEKTGSILITTGSVVTISAISSGSITFTPALSNYTQIRSASLFWLDSTSLGPFYSVTGGGYFPVIDSTAFSVLFSLNSTTTIITQSNSSFYFDSASIVGSNRKFSISYLSESKYTYYDNVADEAYIQLSVDTTSNENSIVFQNGVFNSTTGEVEFTSNTPVKGGIGTSARGIGSFAMGSGSIAQESASIAEGINTLASGLASHAAGINTTASGQAAFSMGIETDADGMASFAAGSGSWARGTATVAMGIGTIASASGQTVVGHYNLGLGDFNNLFVVGGGSGTTTNLRKNLFRVYGGSGASTVGVEINTSETQNTSTIEGFNIIGNTTFQGNISGSVRVGGSNIQLNDDSLNLNATSSFTILDTDRLTGPSPDFNKLVINRFGINFDRSNKSTSPGSKYLWTNSSDRLFYGSSAVILNDGNTLGSAMTIGTTDANNLQLETNNTTRVFISSSGNVGIGTSSPTERLHVDGNLLVTGRITAEEFHTEFVSASIIYQSGSTQFGNSLDDTHIFTGSLNVTGSLSLKGPLYDNLETAGTPDQILFTTSTGVEWRDNIANSAQDLIITGKNVGLTTIEKGTPLYFTGSGTSGNITGILPADAGNPDRMPAGGVAGEQITAGSEGDVYIYGFISGVNTSAFSSGDDVFVAVGGGYTNIKPTGSAFIQKLGNVEKVDSSNGSGVIQGPSWYNDLPNWEIGRVMVGRSTGQPVTSSLVYLDEANGRLGLGTTSPLSTLTVAGGNININDGYSIGGNALGSYVPFLRYNNTGAGVPSSSFGHTTAYITSLGGGVFGTNDLIFYAGGLTQPEIMRIVGSTGFVGIGESSPSARLEIKGSGATSATTAFRVENSNASASLTILNDGTSAFNTNHLYVSSSGNVGIGTTSPQFKLHVLGTAGGDGTFNGGILVENNNATDGEAALAFRVNSMAGASNYWFTGINQSNAYDIAYGTSFTNANTALRIDSNLRIGIGTTSPTSRLQVRGSGATSATTALRVENSNASASLVVLDDGNVGIGTTTPSASLHVEGNFQISTGSLYTYGQNTDIDSGSIRTVMSVSTGSYRAAFFDYVLNKSTNARAGTVFSVWNGTSVEWNDVSTNDIGNTTEVNLSVGLSGANVILYASSSTNDWSMKALARML